MIGSESLETLERFREGNDERFDVIVMNAVLEHVPDPNAFMRAGSELLSDRGVARIDVPREPNLMSMGGSLLSRLRGRRVSYCLSPSWEPYHLHGFSPRPMQALLAKHGLEIRELRVRARARVPTDGTGVDRLRGLGGSVLLAIGNATRLSSNMDLWAGRAD